MSAKTASRKTTPRGKTSRVATQQRSRKEHLTAARAAKHKRAPAASTAKTRSSAKSGAATDQSSKQSRLITMLRSPTGGTLAQMMTLTGWQAHSVRGVISGVLRKKLGLNVHCDAASEDGARIYRIVTTKVAA